MTLPAGTEIGLYEILAPLCAGGPGSDRASESGRERRIPC
jgi:hypothetical protein